MDANSSLPEIPMTEPALRGASGGLYSAEKLGVAPSTCTTAGFNAKALLTGQRFANLFTKEKYFRGTQHDQKSFDFFQRFSPEPSGIQPLMGSVKAGTYIALDERRPCAPFRQTRKIVRGFTSFVFGKDRWPSIKVDGDADTQAFAEGLVRAARLPNVMLRARTLGGSVGTVGLSWRYWEGTPRVQIHNARSLYVHAWADREQLIPAHVTEVIAFERDGWDPKENRATKETWWRRRDWTETADVVFVDVQESDEPAWVIDDSDGATFVHDDGFCHFVWVQNLPDLDGSSEDGESDVETLYSSLDMGDIVNSVLMLAGAQNLDPTVVLGVAKDEVGGEVSLGSNNALALGQGGTASFLSLPSDLITAGKELLGELSSQVHEVTGFVSPDPDKIAAAGTSGKALELLYGPMVQAADTLREQYGRVIEQLLEQMIASARRRAPEADEDGELYYPVETTGQLEEANEGETEVSFFVKLPPAFVEEDILGEDGQPTGEKRKVARNLTPGKGGDVELVWGPYFPPNDTDFQAKAQALGTAAGGKPILAQQTAVELLAIALGRDPAVEWKRMQEQMAREAASQSTMFPDAGNPPLSGGAGEQSIEQPDAAEPVADATEQDAALEQPIEANPDLVLNGAQVQAALAIVTAVAQGELPRDAGIGQLQVLFNLAPAQAEKVMGSVGKEPARGAPPTGA